MGGCPWRGGARGHCTRAIWAACANSHFAEPDGVQGLQHGRTPHSGAPLLGQPRFPGGWAKQAFHDLLQGQTPTTHRRQGAFADTPNTTQAKSNTRKTHHAPTPKGQKANATAQGRTTTRHTKLRHAQGGGGCLSGAMAAWRATISTGGAIQHHMPRRCAGTGANTLQITLQSAALVADMHNT